MAEQQRLRREVVMGRNGMVATCHPLATAAGLEMLQQGGNAMDAAIAAAMVAGVVLPAMCGLGGDIFFIHHDGSSGEITALNGSGIAPQRASREYFTERGYVKMPKYGPLSIGVPGGVDSIFTAIERFCSKSPAELFAAAIRAASEGFPLTHDGHRTIAAAAESLAEYPSSARVFLPNGDVPQPGRLFRQPDLARTLRALVESGPALFYRGELAERMGTAIEEAGGLLSAEDFAGHESEVYSPPSVDYRGYTVYQTRPPSQGHIVLEELNILAQTDLAALGHNSADAVHLMAETKKLAFADRLAYSGDPKFIDVPLDEMLSVDFARRRYQEIDPQRAKEQVNAGVIPESDGDTTYLCAADGQGNAVSFIYSLSAAFGSQFVAGDTGVLLNNRAGRGFTLEEGHPNVIEGGKRTMHTLNCYLITQRDRIRWVGGTPGGDQQPQWNMQVITNLIDYGMNVQQAIEAARWQSFPGTDPANLPADFKLRVESRIDESVIEELRRRGHRVEVMDAWGAGGSAQVIEIDRENEVLQGGSDPRAEGLALGF